MSVEFTIQIKNPEEIMKWLAAKPDETVREIGKAIEKSVYKVNERAKRNSPVDKGRMKASISQKVSERALEGEVAVGVKYRIYVHEGTKPSPGRYVPAIGKRIKTGMHPGQKANPFLRNAVKESEKEIENYLVQAINNICQA